MALGLGGAKPDDALTTKLTWRRGLVVDSAPGLETTVAHRNRAV